MRTRIIQRVLNPRIKSFLKAAEVDRVYYYLQDRIFLARTSVLVEKDLSSLQPLGDALQRAGVEIVRVTTDAHCTFHDEARRKKTLRYLRRGYRGVALVMAGVVVGDIWYWSPRLPGGDSVHPDLKWLPISCGNDDVYGFDLHLCPDNRGKNLANLLQLAALHEMRKDAFKRVFGYYWLDNLPALWVHRTLRFKEVRRVAVTRLFFIRHVT